MVDLTQVFIKCPRLLLSSVALYKTWLLKISDDLMIIEFVTFSILFFSGNAVFINLKTQDIKNY